jgi:hypothetical protein
MRAQCLSPFGSSRGFGGGGFFAGCGFFAGLGAPLLWAVVPPFAAPGVAPGFVAASGVPAGLSPFTVPFALPFALPLALPFAPPTAAPLLVEAPGDKFWFPVDDGTRVATGATRSGGCGTVLRGGVPFDATVPFVPAAGGGVVTDRDAATVRGT